jgi:hypothetical protein
MASTFRRRPELREFYEIESAPLEASRQMLSELLKAIDVNAKPIKVTLHRWGLALFVLSLMGCIPIALIRPS